MKALLKFLADQILFILALAIFITLVIILGTGIALLIAAIGKWTGLGWKIFVYATLMVCYTKAWDVLTWCIDKLADRAQHHNPEPPSNLSDT